MSASIRPTAETATLPAIAFAFPPARSWRALRRHLDHAGRRRVAIPLPTDAVARSRPPRRLHRQWRSQRRPVSRGGPAYLGSGRSDRRSKRVRRRSSGPHECGSRRRRSQSGPAPESGDWIGVWFSESGIESLVRPRGRRRLRLFAGSTGASNVAFRGITPDPTTAVRAVAGSGVDAGQVEGLAQSTKPNFLNVDRQPGQLNTCDSRATRPRTKSKSGEGIYS